MSTVSQAALADDNLLRIHERAAAWCATVEVLRVAEGCRKPGGAVIVSVSRGVGGPPLPGTRALPLGDYDPGLPIRGRGDDDGEAFARAWAALKDLPENPGGAS